MGARNVPPYVYQNRGATDNKRERVQPMKLLSCVLLMVLQVVVVTEAFSAEKRVIVGFRKDAAITRHEKHGKLGRFGATIRREHDSLHVVTANLSDEGIAQLKKDPQIAYVEADSLVSVTEPQLVPGDISPEYSESWGVKHIGADLAALKGVKGAGVKVAILDSGMDYTHPDLKDGYKGGYNFVYDNTDPYDDSRYGHGTHLAGIIAARDNGTGVVGVAPEASLYALKVLNGGLMGSTSDILAGIEWAIANKMDVINMSFGAPMDSQAFRDACDQAAASGILLVAAAGNFKQPQVDNPAGFDSVIAVSAIDQNNTLAVFSNYGTKVELTAPGVAIKSTVPGGGFALMNGTSQAVPHVVGVAALLRSAGLSDAAAIRSRLTTTAKDLGDPGRDIYYGFGLVDAAKAVDIEKHFIAAAPESRKAVVPVKIPLSPGAYDISVENHGLKSLLIRRLDAPGLPEQPASGAGNPETQIHQHANQKGEVVARMHFNPRRPQNTIIRLVVSSRSVLELHPHGSKGSFADVGLSAN